MSARLSGSLAGAVFSFRAISLPLALFSGRSYPSRLWRDYLFCLMRPIDFVFRFAGFGGWLTALDTDQLPIDIVIIRMLAFHSSLSFSASPFLKDGGRRFYSFAAGPLFTALPKGGLKLTGCSAVRARRTA